MEFDSPADHFFSEVQKKWWTKGFFSQKNFLPVSLNVPVRKGNCNFDKPAENFSPEARTKSNLWAHNVFQLKCSSKMFLWKWKMQFLQTWRNFFNRSPKKLCEITIFLNEKIFPKIILWNCRIWFWQSCRKVFTRTPKLFLTL